MSESRVPAAIVSDADAAERSVWHARRASKLLYDLEIALEAMVSSHRDQMVAVRDANNGVTANFNKSSELTIALAEAHAHVAVALAWT